MCKAPILAASAGKSWNILSQSLYDKRKHKLDTFPAKHVIAITDGKGGNMPMPIQSCVFECATTCDSSVLHKDVVPLLEGTLCPASDDPVVVCPQPKPENCHARECNDWDGAFRDE